MAMKAGSIIVVGHERGWQPCAMRRVQEMFHQHGIGGGAFAFTGGGGVLIESPARFLELIEAVSQRAHRFGYRRGWGAARDYLEKRSNDKHPRKLADEVLRSRQNALMFAAAILLAGDPCLLDLEEVPGGTTQCTGTPADHTRKASPKDDARTGGAP